ncbi:MAG: hypothetical protein ACYCY1_05360 [Sulfuriferula sp.]
MAIPTGLWLMMFFLLCECQRTEHFAGAGNNCRNLPNDVRHSKNQEVKTMMRSDWMGSWGNGYMGGWGRLWMILAVILVIVGIVAVIRKK